MKANNSTIHKYGYFWATLALFIISLTGHWLFAWHAYVDEQKIHNEEVRVGSYLIEVSRDTLENWQSEFLQLIWQVAGLALLWHVGSPQSKEGDERKEEKLDALLRMLKPAEAEKVIRELEEKYPKK
ncbi:MAG TPA: DUF6766 family protein [Candidatus Paceibacterota bacterium]|nr:DUF6766 family protein [Candidatus Paceibacterota bacterium]